MQTYSKICMVVTALLALFALAVFCNSPQGLPRCNGKGALKIDDTGKPCYLMMMNKKVIYNHGINGVSN